MHSGGVHSLPEE